MGRLWGETPQVGLDPLLWRVGCERMSGQLQNGWATVVQSGMKPLTIIEYHDILKHNQLALPARGKALKLDTLRAQGAEKTFNLALSYGSPFRHMLTGTPQAFRQAR
jgi:hypothetical protein